MKNTAKNKVRNQELQNLAKESDGEPFEADETISRMYELKELAEDEMGWSLTLACPDFYWIYRVEDQIIGFLKETSLKGESGMIRYLYVHPDHRRNGYGSDMVEQFSQKFESVMVEIMDEEVQEFFKQVEPSLRKVKVYSDWEDHPELDFSDSDKVPIPPYIEKTDVKL